MTEKEQYKAYEEVRKSGVTNMFDTNTVRALSGLTEEQIMFVMKNYTELRKKYENE